MSVFISYRRTDTQQAAGRVADRLIERFGREAVVIDVDTDQVGRDYRTLISEHLEDAQVVLALIGPRFMAEGPDGRRRLDQPHDALRLELTRGLARNVPIVPVLVDGAEMPDPDDLPDDLRDLVFRGSGRASSSPIRQGLFLPGGTGGSIPRTSSCFGRTIRY